MNNCAKGACGEMMTPEGETCADDEGVELLPCLSVFTSKGTKKGSAPTCCCTGTLLSFPFYIAPEKTCSAACQVRV